MHAQFRDRKHAGQLLAARLLGYAGRSDVLLLALPRGGVPVAVEIAARLHAPLDVFVVRKLGVPGHEELAMGAIATGGVRVLNAEVLDQLRIPERLIDLATLREVKELRRREQHYRGDRPPPAVTGQTIILIDDGLATGSTMRAAVSALRPQHPARIVVAVPTAAPSACEELRQAADEVVAVLTPDLFYGVGQWYLDFSQTTDNEVRDLLRQADRQWQSTPA
ncbi:MAG: phosphoribosyltransferase [Verrucomicrobia bacterium]|nr:phosphoribosyltransferase [Verrucomicrobiota bacterium]